MYTPKAMVAARPQTSTDATPATAKAIKPGAATMTHH